MNLREPKLVQKRIEIFVCWFSFHMFSNVFMDDIEKWYSDETADVWCKKAMTSKKKWLCLESAENMQALNSKEFGIRSKNQ